MKQTTDPPLAARPRQAHPAADHRGQTSTAMQNSYQEGVPKGPSACPVSPVDGPRLHHLTRPSPSRASQSSCSAPEHRRRLAHVPDSARACLGDQHPSPTWAVATSLGMWRGRKLSNHHDLTFLLRNESRPVGLRSARPICAATLPSCPHNAAMISWSGTPIDPFGTEQQCRCSFGVAQVVRRLEVGARRPPFIDTLSCSVDSS